MKKVCLVVLISAAFLVDFGVLRAQLDGLWKEMVQANSAQALMKDNVGGQGGRAWPCPSLGGKCIPPNLE